MISLILRNYEKNNKNSFFQNISSEASMCKSPLMTGHHFEDINFVIMKDHVHLLMIIFPPFYTNIDKHPERNRGLT